MHEKSVKQHWQPMQSKSNQWYFQGTVSFHFPVDHILFTPKHSRSYFPSDSNLRRLGVPSRRFHYICMYASLHCKPNAMCLTVLSPSLSFFWSEAVYQASHTFFLLLFVVVDTADLTMTHSLPMLTLHFAHRSWPIHYQCKHCILCKKADPFTTNVNTAFCAQKLTRSLPILTLHFVHRSCLETQQRSSSF